MLCTIFNFTWSAIDAAIEPLLITVCVVLIRRWCLLPQVTPLMADDGVAEAMQ
jgi:hypothetical protein